MPPTVRWFERLALAGVGLSLFAMILNVSPVLERAEFVYGEDGRAAIGAVAGLNLMFLVVWTVIVVTVTRRRNALLRWVYVVLGGLGIVWSLLNFAALPQDPARLVLQLTLAGLNAAAVVLLALPASTPWFKREAQAA